ncbi:SPOR domain-containing protein, partial [Marinibaculum pumilum]
GMQNGLIPLGTPGGGGNGQVPLIAADDGPVKVRPEDRGGITIPDQDKRIYDRLAGSEADPSGEERMLPPPESPLSDMPKAPADGGDGTGTDVVQAPAAPADDGGETLAQAVGAAPAPDGGPLAMQTEPEPTGRGTPVQESTGSETVGSETADAGSEATGGSSADVGTAAADATPGSPDGIEELLSPSRQPVPDPAPQTAPAEAEDAETGPADTDIGDSDTAALREEAPPAPGQEPVLQDDGPAAPAGDEAADDARVAARQPDIDSSAPAPAPEREQLLAPADAGTEGQDTAASDISTTGTAATDAAPAAAAEREMPPGSILLQLAALRDDQGARSEWRRIQGRHSQVLGPMAAHFERVDIPGKGMFTRIQAGPFASAAAAESACASLKAAGQGCFVVRR